MIATIRQSAHASAATAPCPPTQSPRLLDRLRDALRVRHYGIRTEKTYT